MNTLVIRNRFGKRRPLLRIVLTALAVALVAVFAFLLARPAHAATMRASAKESPGASVAAVPAAGDAAAGEGTVNLNTASEDELTMLPGVGPSKAQAVLTWRKKYGSFKKVDDLTKVKGFGAKTLKRLRPHLSTQGATTFKPPAGRARPGRATPPAAADDATP